MKVNQYKQLLKYSRVAMILFAAFLVTFLVSRDIVLSGTISYSHDFLSRSAFFSELVPKQRVVREKTGIRIHQDPIYTTLSYPRPFQTATAELVFSNEHNLFVEYGYQVGPGEDFLLQAIDHPNLNPIFESEENWTGSSEEEGGEASLYQLRSAPYIYTSTQQFWEDLPDQDRTGYYGVDFETPYIPAAKRGKAVVTTPLRGAHQFYLVTNNLPLDVQINFHDINALSEPDDVTATLYDWHGEEIAVQTLIDDRDEVIGLASEELLLRLRTDLVEPNQVVKLVVSASSDIIMTRITSSTSYLVASGHVWVAGGPDYQDDLGKPQLENIRIQTSARSWVASTDSRHTTQRVYIGPEALVVEKPLEKYEYTKSSKEQYAISKGYEIVTENGGLKLVGRGVFAFDKSQYFSPTPWFIDDTISLEQAGMAYVITDYQPPVLLEGGQKTNAIDIDLSKAFAPSKKLRTQFAAPRVSDGLPVTLHELRVDYYSEPVTFSNAVEKAKRFVEREF